MEQMTEEIQLEIYSQYIFLHRNYYALLNMRTRNYYTRFIKEIKAIKTWAIEKKYTFLTGDADKLLKAIAQKIEKNRAKSYQREDEDVVLIKRGKSILIEAKNVH